ncbi:hypothetical protein ACFWN7_12640 [Agromyces sp. NPDC058484]|uniref:SLAC1 family transporter n=1 Tax=Agromyces sp. NPDC058484 TaxID=3346524 RepID=UPI00364BA81A
MLEATAPLVTGAAFVLWAFGTWWIPLLVIFGVWRHIIKRRPFRFEAGLWSIVFPLGTYAAATLAVGELFAAPPLTTLGIVMTVAAAVAWLGTAAMMVIAALGFVKGASAAGMSR